MRSLPTSVEGANAAESSKVELKHRARQAQCLELVTVSLFLSFAFRGFDTNLLVVLLECRQILAGLRELSLFHALTHIPVHESALRVHKVELVVNAGEHFSDGGGVADHAACAHHLGQVATRNNCRRLVINAA